MFVPNWIWLFSLWVRCELAHSALAPLVEPRVGSFTIPPVLPTSSYKPLGGAPAPTLTPSTALDAVSPTVCPSHPTPASSHPHLPCCSSPQQTPQPCFSLPLCACVNKYIQPLRAWGDLRLSTINLSACWELVICSFPSLPVLSWF